MTAAPRRPPSAGRPPAGSRGRSADRGVSTTLGYVLTLSITVVLVAGLLVAGGSFVSGQRERVTETELTVVGHRLAAALESADRLASTPGTATIDTSVGLPSHVAGTTYRIAVVDGAAGGPPTRLVLRSADPSVTTSVTVKTTVDVANGSVDGGDVRITYDDATGRLEVHG